MVAWLPIDAPARHARGNQLPVASVWSWPSAASARGNRSLVNITPWPTKYAVLERHAVADERVAGDLAELPHDRTALNLDERANPRRNRRSGIRTS